MARKLIMKSAEKQKKYQTDSVLDELSTCFRPLESSFLSAPIVPEEAMFFDDVRANIFQGIGNIFSDGDLCDLTVYVGDKEFACHRLILSAVSGFFKSSLTSSWRESSTGKIHVNHEDVTEESFALLLLALYKGKDVVNMETVKGVLKMSVFLQIKFLENHCVSFLSKNMTPLSSLGLWQFAEKYELSVLSQRAFAMALKNVEVVCASKEFQQLNKALLPVLLFSKNINMDTVCQGLLLWVEADLDSRKCHLGQFLPYVDFTQLSRQYLNELLKYMKPPFQEIMYDYITDGLSFVLNDEDKMVQQKIEARQHTVIKSKYVQKCVTLIGGCTDNHQPFNDFVALCPTIQGRCKLYNLELLPEPCGLHFASCVWRNKLYVSGGSTQPKLFAGYSPCDNKWEKLPSLMQGLQKHSMLAFDWNVYVLGGLKQQFTTENMTVSEISVFNTKNCTWKHFSNLLVSIHSAAAVSLGHRIYVFGGQDAVGQARDIVQCVDTQTGCVYQAGRLPSPSFGAQALSRGHGIYLVRAEGDVLEMKENFELADEWEGALADQKSTLGAPASNSFEKDDQNLSPPFAEDGSSLHQDVKEEETRNVNEDEDENYQASDVFLTEKVVEEKNALTVHFKSIATFPKRQHFGSFLQQDLMVVVCGGESEDGELLSDLVSLSVGDKQGFLINCKLPNKMAYIGVHLLNIPRDLLAKACSKAIGSPNIGDKVKLRAGALEIYRDDFDYFDLTESHIGTVTKVPDTSTVTVKFQRGRELTFFTSDIELVD